MATTLFQLQNLALGGADGGIQQSSADGAVDSLECHLIQITSDTVLTVLLAEDGAGNDVNMLTTNNLSGITITAPAVISAQNLHKGGFIKEITVDSGQILRHKLPSTQRS